MQAIEKNNFCILPWCGLEINADGTVRPCCFFSDRIKDGNGLTNIRLRFYKNGIFCNGVIYKNVVL